VPEARTVTTAGEEIRIADLAAPEYTPLQRAAIEAAAQFSVSLTVEAVLDAARAETGLSDFGSDDFRERLSVWLESLEEDEGLSAGGRIGNFRDAVRYASQRLRFEDLLRRHPEIDEVEIDRPILIAGLPRSGTTHLVNLISADRRLRSLPYWESLEPIPSLREGPGADGLDRRFLRCREAWERTERLTPLLKAMHPMPPEHVHEEIELQGLDFSTYVFEWKARIPRWRDYYLAHDQRPHYAYLKRVLKALTWMRGPSRWILKSPQHLEQLVPLHETFPDATIVVTHRDPVSVIASNVTMLAYGARMGRSSVDPPAIASYWIDRIERLLRACVRDRDRIPRERSLDCRFHEFMADDVAMVERIYRLADLEMTPGARRALDDYMAANPRGKHGRIVYDLKADFGVDPDELRERFGFYVERFGVRPGA